MTEEELRETGAADARAGRKPRCAAGAGSVTPTGRLEMPVEYMEGYDAEQRRMAKGTGGRALMAGRESGITTRLGEGKPRPGLLGGPDMARYELHGYIDGMLCELRKRYGADAVIRWSITAGIDEESKSTTPP